RYRAVVERGAVRHVPSQGGHSAAPSGRLAAPSGCLAATHPATARGGAVGADPATVARLAVRATTWRTGSGWWCRAARTSVLVGSAATRGPAACGLGTSAAPCRVAILIGDAA